MHHARMNANLALVEKAIRARKIREEQVRYRPFQQGDWVLVRAEARHKFKTKWYGPYKIL